MNKFLAEKRVNKDRAEYATLTEIPSFNIDCSDLDVDITKKNIKTSSE